MIVKEHDRNIKLKILSLVTIPMLLQVQLVPLVWPPAWYPRSDIIGGLAIGIYLYYNRTMEEYPAYLCTVGYAAIKDGVKGYVTAGHCFDGVTGNFNPPNIWWWNIYQPPNGLNRRYVGSPSHVYGDADYIDTGFVPYSNVKPLVLTLDALGNPFIAPVKGVIRWSDISVNMSVYKTGSVSGVTQGHVKYMFTHFLGSDWVVVIEGNPSINGDSGGPVYIKVPVRIDGFWTYDIYLVSIVYAVAGNRTYTISVDGISNEVGIQPMQG